MACSSVTYGITDTSVNISARICRLGDVRTIVSHLGEGFFGGASLRSDSRELVVLLAVAVDIDDLR